MLYWICPECGRECSPAVRECPVCTAATETPAPVVSLDRQPDATEGILALVQNFKQEPAAPLLGTAVQHDLVATANGHSVPVNSTAAMTTEEPAAHATEAIDALVRPLVESAGLVQPKPVEPPSAVKTVEPAERPLATVEAPPVAEQLILLQAPAAVEPTAKASLRVEPAATAIEPLVPSQEQAPLEPFASAAAQPVAERLVPLPTPPAIEPIAKASWTVKPAAPGMEPLVPSQEPVALEPLAIAAASQEPVNAAPSVAEPTAEAALTVEPAASAIEAMVQSQEPAALEPLAIAAASLEPVNAAPSVAEPTVEAALTVEPAASAIEPPVPSREPAVFEPAATAAASPEPVNAAPPVAEPIAEAAMNVEPAPGMEPLVPSQEPAAIEPLAIAAVSPEPVNAASSVAEPIAEAALNVESAASAIEPPVPLQEPAVLEPTASTVVESVAPADDAESAPAQIPASEPALATQPTEAADTGLAPTELPQPVSDTHALARALEIQAEALVDAIAQQLEAEKLAILAVAASFQEPPKTPLLNAPAEIVAAPAPPVFERVRTPRPVLAPRSPLALDASSLMAGPQTPPLAGPCLPPRVRNSSDKRSAAQRRNRIGIPTWTVSLLVATGLFLGAGSLLQYITANREARAAGVPATQTAATTPAPVPAEHPAARFVEVAGLRIVVTGNRRPQLQYLVVNHSATELSAMAIRIDARPADAPSNAQPLFTATGVVPALGPYQSREMRTELDAELRSAVIPEWQSLRTDVIISARK
jgi:hypothetical protein